MSSLTKKNSDTSLKFVYSDDNSISVIFQKNTLLRGVVGEFDTNLKELEKLTKADIYFRVKRLIDKNSMGGLFKVMLATKKNVNFQTGFIN